MKFNEYMWFKKDYVKEMKYCEDQIGIFDRYQNEFDNWEPHLLNTRRFILENCNCQNQKPLAVLGSGWLLDVPVMELLQKFPKVVCYDIKHPEEVLYKFRNNKNVEFVQFDLTGGAAQYFFQLSKGEKKTNSPVWDFPYKKIDFSGFEMIISLNLLNQLDRLIIDYLANFKRYTADDLQKISKAIQQNHINNIIGQNAILIFDYEELRLKDGKLMQSVPLVFCDLPASSKMEEWEWRFDFHQAYFPDHDVVFKVKALKI